MMHHKMIEKKVKNYYKNIFPLLQMQQIFTAFLKLILNLIEQ
jgi:hypothetical protein